ncbi:MAG: hypothetical protein LVT47_10675 [Cyanobacteria bacterium LVE1205-1]|jgi:hypothetical protein
MQITLSKYAQRALLAVKEHLQGEDDDAIEEAILQMYHQLVDNGKIKDIFDSKPKNLMDAIEDAGLLDREFSCIFNSDGQEYIISAKTEEDAWQQIAIRFPNEVIHGFRVEECNKFYPNFEQ